MVGEAIGQAWVNPLSLSPKVDLRALMVQQMAKTTGSSSNHTTNHNKPQPKKV
jgi:hypothetical protein